MARRVSRIVPAPTSDPIGEEFSLINAAIAQLASADPERRARGTFSPFISGFAGTEAQNADTTDESDIDIVIVRGTGAFRLPPSIQVVEPDYDNIHAVCETVERAHLISYEVPKNPQSLGDEALRLLDHIASVRASRVIDHKTNTWDARWRFIFFVGIGIGTTLIKQCLLQSRMSIDPLHALIWRVTQGIVLLSPMTRDDLTKWQTMSPSELRKSSSVENRPLVTWRDVREVELEYDAAMRRPSTFSVNLPKVNEWPGILNTLNTAATPEDAEPVERLRDIKRVLSEWRSSKLRASSDPIDFDPSGKKLLSLDGGGLKGISSLMLLNELMEEIARREGDPEKTLRKPVNYFDLAGGTSTGGLIAILLFRLRMDVPTALRMYEQLGKDIFEPNPLATTYPKLKWLTNWAVKPYTGARWLAGGASYAGEALEDAVDRILTDQGEIDANSRKDVKLWDPRTRSPDLSAGASDPSPNEADGRGAMFVCATLHDEQRGIRFRTYETQADVEASEALDTNSHYHDRPIRSPEKTLRTTISIKDAVRATSAAPTYFPEKVIDDYRFWDGGLLNNNPIDQVWAARNELDERPVVCLLSVGASYGDNLGRETNLLKLGLAVTEYATNTEGKHKDFEAKWKSMQTLGYPSFLYARLNVPTGHDKIAMDKVEHMDLLKQKTREYLQTYSAKTTINQLASVLHKPAPSGSLDALRYKTQLCSGSVGSSPFYYVQISTTGVNEISPGLAILGAKREWLQLIHPHEPTQVEGTSGVGEGKQEAEAQVQCDFRLAIAPENLISSDKTYVSVSLTFHVRPIVPITRAQRLVEISLSESTLEHIKATCQLEGVDPDYIPGMP